MTVTHSRACEKVVLPPSFLLAVYYPLFPLASTFVLRQRNRRPFCLVDVFAAKVPLALFLLSLIPRVIFFVIVVLVSFFPRVYYYCYFELCPSVLPLSNHTGT